MNKTSIFATLGGAALLAATALAFTSGRSAATEVMLYKNPQCGCCEEYADYLRGHGFDVKVKATHDLVEMSEQAGVPGLLHGCHLSHVEGYAVSGHVPIDTLRRLLAERPDIKGISLPGMPQGSPGMSGIKDGPFKIYQFGNGEPRVYATE